MIGGKPMKLCFAKSKGKLYVTAKLQKRESLIAATKTLQDYGIHKSIKNHIRIEQI